MKTIKYTLLCASILALGAIGGAIAQITGCDSHSWLGNGFQFCITTPGGATYLEFETGNNTIWAAPQHIFSDQTGAQGFVVIGHDAYFPGLGGVAGTLHVDTSGKVSVVP